MKEWSAGQLALFNALEEIVERLGGPAAGDVASSVSAANGEIYLKELRELRVRSTEVEGLRKENSRLQTQLQSALRDLHEAKTTKTATIEPENVVVQKETAIGVEHSGETVSYDEIIAKYKLVKSNLHDMKIARQVLEDELRKSKKQTKGWLSYVDGVNKRNLKLQALLDSHGIAVADALRSEKSLPRTPHVLSSSPMVPPTLIDSDVRSRRSTSQLLISHWDPEMDGVTLVETALQSSSGNPTIATRLVQINAKTDHDVGNCPQTQTDTRSLTKMSDYSATVLLAESELQTAKKQAEDSSTTSIAFEITAQPLVTTQRKLENSDFPPSSQSNSTQSDHGASYHAPNDVKPESIEPPEAESQDTPVIISCRAVKKNRGGNENTSLPETTTVKIEILSSSPIRLAAFQTQNPYESVDLDEIGEKVITPKRGRQKHMSNSNISRTRPRRELGQNRLLGNPSALQKLITNQQILPRTSGKEMSKRRRLDEHGASIFSEDGDHDNIARGIEIQDGGAGIIAGSLGDHLTILLDEPSPERPVLTPRTNILEQSTQTIIERPVRVLPNDNGTVHSTNKPVKTTHPKVSYMKYSPRSVSQSSKVATGPLDDSSFITPNQLNVYRAQTLKEVIKKQPQISSSRPLFTETSIENDGPDHEPYRARPIRRLGLEHFKINRDANQGYDFAFSDVVRGREQRKCLRGCTKPECCGEIFRKLAELTTWEQGTPTISQEERDDNLLKDFVGDNVTRLRNMSEGERRELLIQAKTRDMANRHGKHRHTHERKRSPPGFWRTDFPTTQEQETDRVEAFERERELVKKRYEEAMRHGGAWRFRDE